MERPVSAVVRVILVVAATVVILAGIRWMGGLLGGLALAVFFALLCRPLYVWLLDRGAPAWLALAALALLLLVIVLVLVGIVVGSAAGLVANIDKYQVLLGDRLEEVRGWLERADVTPDDLGIPADTAGALSLILGFVSAAAALAMNFFYILLATLFLVVDGPRMMRALHGWLGASHPLIEHLEAFGPEAARYFGLRTIINALTGAALAAAFLFLGVDFALLWGVLMFFLSYVPYIGIYLAGAPPVLLALAEHGVVRALIVLVLIVVVNQALESIVAPRLMARSFRMTGFAVYASFFFWAWMLGAPGALLSVFLTQLVITLLESSAETSGLARILTGPEPKTQPAPEQRAPAPAPS